MSPPASIAIIVNARAGAAAGHAQIETELAALFRAAGHAVEIIVLRDGDDPGPAARDASRHAAIVVAAGGDGTVSSVAAALVDSAAALGVLPLGTLNHFAKDLQIPLDLEGAVAVIAAGHIRAVDVGQVNDSVFVNNSSIGIYPSIVDAREALRGQGHAKWPAMALATIRVLWRYRGVTVSIDVDGHRRSWRTPFVFVGNNEYEIDGIRMGKRTRLDEGALFVYLAPRLHAYQLPLLLAKALVGRARRSGDFEIVPASELWIGTSRRKRRRVAVDGEVRRMTTPLHYRARAGALRVVVPQA
ncbi:MAG: diacylglycerol kinase catalytic domain family protein [Acidobacteria bacterium]|nr:diacylglycerol kinase catalytic domain family protein [Acidobacteriota bacterium]